jgi:uncharacterized protein YegP (UPF0339 family)
MHGSRRSSRFEVYQDRAREWRWRLVTSRGRIIADCGEGYSTQAGCRAAVEALRIHVGNATPPDRVYPSEQREGRR